MTELDVINNALATMGISPLNQLDDTNPDVANIRRIIRQKSEEVQATGWWFNTELIDLYPDALSGFIYTPNDAIICDPVKKEPILPIVQRGSRLYDTDRNTYDFTGYGFVRCRLIRLIPFDDLPPSAKRAVSVTAVRNFQQSFDADPQKMARLDQEFVIAMAGLKSEHTKDIRPNLLNKSTTLNALNRISGSSYRWR